jgi:hypothetical protein
MPVTGESGPRSVQGSSGVSRSSGDRLAIHHPSAPGGLDLREGGPDFGQQIRDEKQHRIRQPGKELGRTHNRDIGTGHPQTLFSR